MYVSTFFNRTKRKRNTKRKTGNRQVDRRVLPSARQKRGPLQPQAVRGPEGAGAGADGDHRRGEDERHPQLLAVVQEGSWWVFVIAVVPFVCSRAGSRASGFYLERRMMQSPLVKLRAILSRDRFGTTLY